MKLTVTKSGNAMVLQFDADYPLEQERLDLLADDAMSGHAEEVTKYVLQNVLRAVEDFTRSYG